jgi:hypothetical protein
MRLLHDVGKPRTLIKGSNVCHSAFVIKRELMAVGRMEDKMCDSEVLERRLKPARSGLCFSHAREGARTQTKQAEQGAKDLHLRGQRTRTRTRAKTSTTFPQPHRHFQKYSTSAKQREEEEDSMSAYINYGGMR